MLKLSRVALGRLAIELLQTDEKSAGGIFFPFGKETLANVGRVIMTCEPYEAAEDDEDEFAPEGPLYSVGDLVCFGKYNGTEIELNAKRPGDVNAEKFTIIGESDVWCVLVDTDPQSPEQ